MNLQLISPTSLEQHKFEHLEPGLPQKRLSHQVLKKNCVLEKVVFLPVSSIDRYTVWILGSFATRVKTAQN